MRVCGRRREKVKLKKAKKDWTRQREVAREREASERDGRIEREKLELS